MDAQLRVSCRTGVGDADLVNKLAVGNDHWMIGFAAQNIDRTAGLVAFLRLVSEKWPRDGLGDPAPGIILVQSPLKGSHEHIALSPVVKNYPKPSIGSALGGDVDFAHLGNESLLTTDDEEAAWLDLCFQFERTRSPGTFIQLPLHLLE